MSKIFTAAIVIFLFLMTMVSAIEENREIIFGAEELLIGIHLSSEFELIAEKPDYAIDYVTVNLTLFPKQGIQKTQITKLEPQAKVEENSLLFEWDKPDLGKLQFSAAADVITTSSFIPIKAKAKFPIVHLEENLKQYTLDSKNIDSYSQDIINLASSLAAGEDDLFVVVYKLAEWSNKNIAYNLSTLTAKTTKPASWVLENRQGVCDELTNLFLALNRALGIPARFVSGIAYTDSELFQERWGFHGWAEVYFPGSGWIPFDVTYGEFGFVDTGHIKLQDAVDVSKTTTNYQWRGRNVQIKTSQLKPEITLKDAIGKVGSDIALRSRVLKDVVGFGSYNIEEVQITNLKDKYVVAELVHSNTQNLELIGQNKRDILLKPKEKKLEYFVFKVNHNLKDNYIYTFPLSLNAYLAYSNASFKSSAAANAYSLDEVNALRLDQEEVKIYSREIELHCSSHAQVYLHETSDVKCTVYNTGNVALNNLYFCHDGNCQRFSVGITRSKDFNFQKSFNSTGNKKVEVLVDSDEIIDSVDVYIKVVDKPSLLFDNVNYPSSIEFDDVFDIEFMAVKASDSVPLKVSIEIKPTTVIFNFDRVDENKMLSANLNALNMQEGPNRFVITSKFEDSLGRIYNDEKQVTITVSNLNFFQKIKKFYLRLFD